MSLLLTDDLLLPLAAAAAAALFGWQQRAWVHTRNAIPLLLLLTIPSVWLGYVYGVQFTWSQTSVTHQRWTWIALYALRFAPLAAVLASWLPRTISPSAVHMLSHSSLQGLSKFRLRVQHQAAPFLITVLLLFLMLYHEFELSSLLNLERWPVRLFDAHAGGLPLATSIQKAFGYLAPLLLPLGLLFGLRPRQSGNLPTPHEHVPCNGMLASCAFALEVTVLFLIPFFTLLNRLDDARWTAELHHMRNDLFYSLQLAILSSGFLALLLLRSARIPFWAILGIVPFFLGPMVFGLGILSLTSERLASSSLPLAFAQFTLHLIPLGICWRILMDRTPPSGRHLLRQSPQEPHTRWIRSRLEERPLILVTALAFLWLVTELTLGSLLAPTGATPAAVRLYNLMHYGRSSALSSMLILCFLVPLLLTAGTVSVWYILRRPRHG